MSTQTPNASTQPAVADMLQVNTDWDLDSLDGMYGAFNEIIDNTIDSYAAGKLTLPAYSARLPGRDAETSYMVSFIPDHRQVTIQMIPARGQAHGQNEYIITTGSISRRRMIGDRVFRKEWRRYFNDGGNYTWDVVYDEHPRTISYIQKGKVPSRWYQYLIELEMTVDAVQKHQSNPTSQALGCAVFALRRNAQRDIAISSGAARVLQSRYRVLAQLSRCRGEDLDSDHMRSMIVDLLDGIGTAALCDGYPLGDIEPQANFLQHYHARFEEKILAGRYQEILAAVKGFSIMETAKGRVISVLGNTPSAAGMNVYLCFGDSRNIKSRPPSSPLIYDQFMELISVGIKDGTPKDLILPLVTGTLSTMVSKYRNLHIGLGMALRTTLSQTSGTVADEPLKGLLDIPTVAHDNEQLLEFDHVAVANGLAAANIKIDYLT